MGGPAIYLHQLSWLFTVEFCSMCGIFGVLARSVSPELLSGAQRSLAHRGPDDVGSVVISSAFSDGRQLGLAHTRLSIIDLSPLGHQPMQDPETGNWIVFNGEVYNFSDLRSELEAAGAAFRSKSDTEVVLAAYRAWGEACFGRLRGMFALALWDAGCRQLLLARDPMGIKPLYYSDAAGHFVFASEVRTLLQTGMVPRKVDATGLLSFLAFGSVYEPWTMVEGVKAVTAGHLLRIGAATVQLREYSNPLRSVDSTHPNDERSKGTDPSQLTRTLRGAVLSHLVSDVPVGIFLSGGIDSSSLVAVLSQNGIRPNTFSLVFREKEYDEARYSREIARRFSTDHCEIPVSIDDTLSILPEALRAMDQPTVDGINTYFVSAKARAAGIKVALTGLGADELFAGYSNFKRVPRMERMAASLDRLPSAAQRSLRAVVKLAGGGDRGRKLAQLIDCDNTAVHPYFLVRGLFSRAEQRELFPADEYSSSYLSLQEALDESVSAAAQLDPVNRVSYLESRWYMRNTLLRDSDFMSMAHGLELRVPFLDLDLVDACFQIPGARKVAGRLPKGLLLANLGVELPVEVVNRPKRGFTLPFECWLRDKLKPLVENSLVGWNAQTACLNSGAVQRVWNRFLAGQTSWSRPWSLFVLARWCEENL